MCACSVYMLQGPSAQKYITSSSQSGSNAFRSCDLQLYLYCPFLTHAELTEATSILLQMLQATAEPTPDPQPDPGTCELITNGGFEDGDGLYPFTASSFSGAVRDDGAAHSGEDYFYIYDYYTQGTLSQTLGSCPGAAPTCTLSLCLLTAATQVCLPSLCACHPQHSTPAIQWNVKALHPCILLLLQCEAGSLVSSSNSRCCLL